MEYIRAKYTKHTVDLQLNNGKSFKNIEFFSSSENEKWQVFKLQDESIMQVPITSIAYMITVKFEVLEDED